MSEEVTDRRYGLRYLAALPVRAEWDDDSGRHVVVDGETENVGPEGALVHFQRLLPEVGCRVQLAVLDDGGPRLQVVTEVLRLERNVAHPLAALQLIDAADEWRGLVWEPAAPQVSTPANGDGDDEELDEDEIIH